METLNILPQSLCKGQLGLCKHLSHTHEQLAYRYHRTRHCLGVQNKVGMRTCMGHYFSHMPGIEIPRTQSGICGEDFAVTVGLAEPPQQV